MGAGVGRRDWIAVWLLLVLVSCRLIGRRVRTWQHGQAGAQDRDQGDCRRRDGFDGVGVV